MSDREPFLKMIAENPLDETNRLVFADWLDEHDEPEEASRQRAWVKSFLFLRSFSRSYDDARYSGEEDDDGNSIRYAEGDPRLEAACPVKVVMDEIENWWVPNCKGEGGQPGFGTDEASERMSDPATRDSFFEALEVVTCYVAPEHVRTREYYSCAC